MAIGDVYRAAYVGTWNGQQVVNVFHFKMKSNALPEVAIPPKLGTSIYSLYKAFCQTTCTWNLVQIRRLSVPLEGIDYNIPTPITGTQATATQPMSHAVVVSLRTPYAGRRYRGRIYLPGLVSGYISNGTVATTQRNSIQTYFDDFVAAVGAAGSDADLQWGVFSRVIGEVKDLGGHITAYNLAGFTPITSVIVRTNLGSMRTREIGKGQ